ncbi:MAG: CinA family protein [Micrococcaceae bacterium]|nr:CinA family protein [Micrococcaceae bacterium]
MTGGGTPALAARIISEATRRGITVATAESLTAGWISAALADVPGASAVLRGGVVSYHNQVKQEVLGVDASLLESRGSVDAEVARRMAVGARRICTSDVAVASTGVAGPEAHDGKEVGTVFIGHAGPHGSGAVEFRFTGGRQAIRAQACERALERLLELIEAE